MLIGVVKCSSLLIRGILEILIHAVLCLMAIKNIMPGIMRAKGLLQWVRH